ncbi:MAG: hypothetical protein AAFO81_13445 [Pseudomonadota bacterium]
MKSVGMWMAIFGAGSFVLNMMGREFSILAWIDSWGPTIGTGIRAGLIVVGVILFLAGMKQESAEQPEA